MNELLGMQIDPLTNLVFFKLQSKKRRVQAVALFELQKQI